MTKVHEGLEGVVVTKTRLSAVDGEAGRLVVAGRSIEALSGEVSFEALVATLIDGATPDTAEPGGASPTAARLAQVKAALAQGRVLATARLAEEPHALAEPDGMLALRALTAGLSLEDPLCLIGAVGALAASWACHVSGRAVPTPDPARTHAEDLLRIALGGAGAADMATFGARAAALEAYLVTVMDHGMNASTFTARVIASTGSDLTSAITGAIGALKGPLHGGAPGPVLDMLEAIGAPSNAEEWLAAELAAGRRIMGMGHRIYRVRDPRAEVLERAAKRLEAAGVATPRLALARGVEAAAAALLAKRHPARALQANVEFYTAVLLDAVGLDRRAFAPMFAAGRVAGWCAHVLEQRARGRLIRPESLYDGPVAR